MKRRTRHRSVTAIGLVIVVAVSVGVIAAAGAGSGGRSSEGATTAKKKPKKYEDSELFVEINGTDRDAGLHMELVGDQWTRLKLTNPNGRRVLAIGARSKLGAHGLASMNFESSEPTFDELPFARFKKRFPEGRYRFRGRTTEGRALAGSDRLTHDVPSKPVVSSPPDGGKVDPNGFVFRWEPVTKPKGIEIDRYQLTVSNEDDPNGELVIEVGPRVRSATIHDEYLEPGTQYAAELIAREKSGNQTIGGLEFKTGG